MANIFKSVAATDSVMLGIKRGLVEELLARCEKATPDQKQAAQRELFELLAFEGILLNEELIQRMGRVFPHLLAISTAKSYRVSFRNPKPECSSLAAILRFPLAWLRFHILRHLETRFVYEEQKETCSVPVLLAHGKD